MCLGCGVLLLLPCAEIAFVFLTVKPCTLLVLCITSCTALPGKSVTSPSSMQYVAALPVTQILLHHLLAMRVGGVHALGKRSYGVRQLQQHCSRRAGRGGVRRAC